MWRLLCILGLAAALAGPLGAREAVKRGFFPTDAFFTKSGLRVLLRDESLEFKDGSVRIYGPRGKYTFIAGEGVRPVQGRYDIGDRGWVCHYLKDGSHHCGTYVRSSYKVVFVQSDGFRLNVNAFLNDEGGE
ncbi:MAG: hypothetical protein OIF40_02445 [Mangrovicoccus sp.]|nr:hypothetical protein [Mangrovicoccus sp.]